MSWWVEILLTATRVEDTGTSGAPIWPAIDELNAFLAPSHMRLYEVMAPNQGHAPGAVFVGSFKGVNIRHFVHAVETAPWQWPEQVQLFIREEDDKGFRVARLRFPNGVNGLMPAERDE